MTPEHLLLKLTLSVFPCHDFLCSATYGCCHPCLSSIITCLLFSFASENFQVMNYGIGGQISLHGDNPGLPKLESALIGGKIVFWMTSGLLGSQPLWASPHEVLAFF